MDELFELLTLQQTRKAPPAPIALYDESYWKSVVNFDRLIDEGMIATEDMSLLEFVNTPEELWSSFVRRGLTAHSQGSEVP
jgi:predicted Rossmann-fold nucleotide-binding protein